MRPKHADRVASTPGVLAKVRAAKRSGPDSPLRAKDSAGIRKTSGRVGTAGATAMSATAASTARKVSGS